MKYELTTRRAEWVKAFMVAIPCLVLYAQFLFVAHCDFFLKKKSVGQMERRNEQIYAGIQVSPIDEFAGLESE